MMFRKEHGKVNVTSLLERVSRYAVVMRNENRQPKPIMEALVQGLAPLPADARQSITFDRGTEFSARRHLSAGIGADAWFCDPQAPYQKGTVENTNNRLRKYLPRSNEPTSLTNRYLRRIATASIPRRASTQILYPGGDLRNQADGNPEPIGIKRHIGNCTST